MQKTLNFLIIVSLGTFIAGIYGILHDQVTYTISPEYYRLVKFDKLSLNDLNINNERYKVAIVGYLATWWIGLAIGIIYGVVSLFLDVNRVLNVTTRALFIHLLITLLFGIVGFSYSSIFLQSDQIPWSIPQASMNIQNFINVGTMHNFGYLGGFFGCFYGVYYQLSYCKKSREL